MLALDERGLHCARGGFHLDPVKPVPRAVFTGEHRRIEGCGEAILPGPGPLRLGEVTVTFHPSGFAPGAAQVRLASGGEAWVVTGDWKRGADPLVAPFEPVPCDTLVLAAPFALPIFRWDDPGVVAAWLLANERCALFASPVLALRLQAQLAVPLRRHEDLEPLARRYAELGVAVPPSDPSSERLLCPLRSPLPGAPPLRGGGRRLVRAIVDGSARIRGPRRRANFDSGFALSEHGDWEEVLATVADSKARRVLAQGPHADALARFLREERGLASEPL